MIRQESRSLVSFILRSILGVVFIYSGVLKILSPLSFADSIASYRIVPSNAINLLASGLPPLEILSGLLLITGFNVRVGILTVSLMLTAFSIALLSVIIRGLSIDCGCFGGSFWIDSNPWFALIRNLVLLCAGIYLYSCYLAIRQGESKSLIKAS